MSVYAFTVVSRLQEVEPFRRLVERALEATFPWCVLLLPAVHSCHISASVLHFTSTFKKCPSWP
eukprot:5450266-Pleurochrysis_carterae.AAC.1